MDGKFYKVDLTLNTYSIVFLYGLKLRGTSRIFWSKNYMVFKSIYKIFFLNFSVEKNFAPDFIYLNICTLKDRKSLIF